MLTSIDVDDNDCENDGDYGDDGGDCDGGDDDCDGGGDVCIHHLTSSFPLHSIQQSLLAIVMLFPFFFNSFQFIFPIFPFCKKYSQLLILLSSALIWPN